MDKCKYKYFFEFYQKLYRLKSYEKVMDLYHNFIYTNDINEIEKKLIDSLIYKENYTKKLPYEKFKMCIETINNIKYKNYTNDVYDELLELTDQKSQVDTIKRLIYKKSNSFGYLCNNNDNNNDNDNDQDIDNNTKITKRCPYCSKSYSDYYSTTDYVICGYSSKGFDWEGCGHDWCFKCGKKLCKCWNINELYNKLNRYHNNRCCRLHAYKTDSSYPEDYCYCGDNKHVNRL